MNSFKNIIGASADALRETRVKNVVRNTEAASRNRVETAKQTFRDMQSKLEDILDIGATNTQDIATHLKGFDANKFIDAVYPLAVEMAVKAREVGIMVTLHNRLFPENTVDGLDEDDKAILNGISL